MGTRTKFLGRSTHPKTPTFFLHLTRRPCIYFRRREIRRFPSRFLRPFLFRRKFHVLQLPSHFQCTSGSLWPCLSHPLRWSYIGFWWLFPISKHIIALLYDLGLGSSKMEWSVTTTDTSSLPSPRVAFAAAFIAPGRIIIQGGCDSGFQTNFADGWVLDTTTNPWKWSSIDALSQVGPRRDHFAVSFGGQVIFGFGKQFTLSLLPRL
jgi:hypothetical protein